MIRQRRKRPPRAPTGAGVLSIAWTPDVTACGNAAYMRRSICCDKSPLLSA